MRIAILILCHKNPHQINQLINALMHKKIDIFLHVDKKSKIISQIHHFSDNVFFVPNNRRIDVKWGTFSEVKATLLLLETAIKKNSYDYYWLISGQDFPLVCPDKIVSYLGQSKTNYINLFKTFNTGAGHSTNYDKRNEIIFKDWMLGRNFIFRIIRRGWVELTGGYSYTYKCFKRKNTCKCRFFFGSQWWCLTGETIEYIMLFVKNKPQYVDFYRSSSCPDESFFQTIVMNSPFASSVKDNLHYIDWSKGGNSPKILTSQDLPTMLSSHKLMARKIDIEIDERIIKNIICNYPKPG